MRGFDLDLLAQATLICFICCASLVAPTNLSITLYKFKKEKKKVNGTGDNNMILIFFKVGEKHKTTKAFMFD